MDATLGLLTSTGWGSGVNLYLVVAGLGLAGRTGWTEVPATLEHPAVIAVAGLLYLIEFVADKIPVIDSVWDGVHTVIRPVGGAAVGLILSGDADTLVRMASAGTAGSLAFVAHAAKATARAAINTSPEPATNIAVSLGEDGLVAGLLVLAIANPWLAVAAVVVLTIASIVLVVSLWKLARKALTSWRGRREPRVSRISGKPLP